MDESSLKEIARQLSCPVGKNGIATSKKMNALNVFISQKTIEYLAPEQGESIIEIGPGNGLLSLPIIESIGAQGRYFGIDQSADMARLAMSNLQNKACPCVDIICGDSSKAKVENSFADGLLAVNVLYFIDDLTDFFTHIKKWLKPNGRAVFGVRSPKTLNATPVTQYGFHIRTIETIEQSMLEAGFCHVSSTQYDEGMSSFDDIELAIDSVIITGWVE